MLLLKTVVIHITKSFGLSVQNLIYKYIYEHEESKYPFNLNNDITPLFALRLIWTMILPLKLHSGRVYYAHFLLDKRNVIFTS